MRITLHSAISNMRRNRPVGVRVERGAAGSIPGRRVKLRGLAYEAYADGIVPCGRDRLPAGGHTKRGGAVVPRAAFHDALVVTAVPVLAPLGDISQHVVQAPAVGRFCRDGLRPLGAAGMLRQPEPGDRRELGTR